MSKHTPGPWKVEENFHWNRKVNVVPGTGKDWRTIAFCSNLNEADARLIAQAPAMLECLKLALNDSGCDGDLCCHEWHETARAIIRATEGGE